MWKDRPVCREEGCLKFCSCRNDIGYCTEHSPYVNLFDYTDDEPQALVGTPEPSAEVEFATVAQGFTTQEDPDFVMPDSVADPHENCKGWQEAATEVHYRFRCFSTTKDELNRAHHLIELANALSDLSTFIDGYDYNTGTLPWEREAE